MRVALVHDYLVHVRGGERVFEALCAAYPEADIYALIYDPDRMPALYRERSVSTSFIQHLPLSRRLFRLYLPLYPVAAASMGLRDYDLVISSSSAWAHGVRVGPGTLHICYCYSPFRYAWSHHGELVGSRGFAVRVALRPLMAWIRDWDRRAASRVNAYVAISRVTQARIAAYYGRESTIIHPPVELSHFAPSREPSANYFLVVSALMRYKRVDIAIEAFNRLGWPLKIVGGGEDEARLRAMAGHNIEFLGQRSDDEVARLYARCRAFIFTADEDFGITPLEAMASGRPVVAYEGGGALETVVDGVSGRFFPDQTADSLAATLQTTDFDRFDRRRLRRHAEKFAVANFQQRFTAFVADQLKRRPDAGVSLHRLQLPGNVQG